MKNIKLAPAVKATIKINWKSINRNSSDLIAYLILTRNNNVIEKSFKKSKCKNSYNKTSLVHGLLNIDVERISNDLLYNTNITSNEIKQIKDYMKFRITQLLLSHLGKINVDPVYKKSRSNFTGYWKRYAKNKKMNNVSFLIFTLLNKDNIWENLKKAFPVVKNKNKEFFYDYGQSTDYAGLMKTFSECRSLPSVYYRVLGYNLQKTILMKVIPNLYSTLIYEEKK